MAAGLLTYKLFFFQISYINLIGGLMTLKLKSSWFINRLQIPAVEILIQFSSFRHVFLFFLNLYLLLLFCVSFILRNVTFFSVDPKSEIAV